MNGEDRCCECGEPATWIRSTQFAGDHPYCTKHAHKEKDFGKNDSYGYWVKIKQTLDFSQDLKRINRKRNED